MDGRSAKDNCTSEIISAAMRVHTLMGPGLLESAYEACLAYELRKRGFRVETQVPVPITYDGVELEVGYRIDMLVNDKVIVELKTVTKLILVHHAQLLSHLRLKHLRIGLLINFHELHLRDGIKRVLNGF